MPHIRRWTDQEDEQTGANRQTASLFGLAITLVVVVLCLMLVHALQREARMEDCLMSGRTNCAEVCALR